MGALIGLGFGIGLMLIWSVGALPRPEGQRPTRKQHLRELLDQAGLESVSVAAFLLLALILGGAAALVLQVVSRTPPVAFAFGLMGAYLPVALVAGRARRRQREFAEVWPEAVDRASPRSLNL